MVAVAEAIPVPLRLPALREMFEARKRVFVDLLKWDVPVLEGRFEIDQFDDEHAAYLIVPAEAEARDLQDRVSALVGYALENGVETYTGVAEMGWLQQILAFGWRCRPLGLPA